MLKCYVNLLLLYKITIYRTIILVGHIYNTQRMSYTYILKLQSVYWKIFYVIIFTITNYNRIIVNVVVDLVVIIIVIFVIIVTVIAIHYHLTLFFHWEKCNIHMHMMMLSRFELFSILIQIFSYINYSHQASISYNSPLIEINAVYYCCYFPDLFMPLNFCSCVPTQQMNTSDTLNTLDVVIPKISHHYILCA